MSIEPIPPTQPGDRKPQEDGPPPLRRPIQFAKCCHEHRIDELEKALKTVGEWARNHDSRYISSKECLKDIANKCREVLRGE